ncbi:autophagy-related 18a isoform X1 [Dermacentor variabilis]|uniref:autophagy-related 18a isoform X1 n=1 Tax=Dermacentor variabilis TaxID=34621 RepID=UPI003F5C4C70
MQSLTTNLNTISKGVKYGVGGLMNLAAEGGEHTPYIAYVNFNQDGTSLSVGTQSGYKFFSLANVDKLEQIYENDEEGMALVERLFLSSLVSLVSAGSLRKLKMCHFKKESEICNYSYSNSILAVRLNRARLVVCLEESLYIHNIRDMKDGKWSQVLHTIRETPPNTKGLCALSPSSDNCYLAYPGSDNFGEVQIFDALNLQAKVMIPAHNSALAALAFNSTGTLIATASTKGTVIRVFCVADGQKLYEFRRGMKRCADIYSLAFSADSLFLCASSNFETVHIFKLEDPKEANKVAEEPGTWMGYLGKALMQSASYLPTQVTDVFNQGRSFATVHLPFSGVRTVCCLSTIQKIPRVLVATKDGYLYVYNLDPVEGGDCTLYKQHRLDGREATTATPSQSGDAASDQVTAHGTSQPAPAPRKPDSQGLSSYAAVVRGYQDHTPADAAGMVSLSPPTNTALRLTDDSEFPPVSQKCD